MSLPTQVIPVNFGQGLDTKSNPKAVVQGKCLRLENVVFTQARAIVKRNGYTSIPRTIVGGGSITAPKLVKVIGDELICADQGQIFSYSPALLAWVPRGPYIPVGVTNKSISTGSTPKNSQVFQTSAVAGNLALYSWNSADAADQIVPLYGIYDLTSGSAILADVVGTAGGGTGVYGCPKACTIANSELSIFQLDNSNQLIANIFSATSSGISQSVTTVATNPVGYAYNSKIVASYDVVGTATGAVLAYSAGATFGGAPTSIIVKTLDLNAIATHTATIAGIVSASPITISITPNGNIWVFWVNTAGGGTQGFVAIFSPTLTVILAPTGFSVGSGVTQLAAAPISNTQQTLLYSFPSGALSPNTFNTNALTVTSTGTTSNPGFQGAGIGIYSKPFLQGSIWYVAMIYQSKVTGVATGYILPSPQTSVLLCALNPVNASSGLVISRSFHGQANGTLAAPGFLTTPISLGANKWGILGATESSAKTVSQGVVSQILGSTLIQYDFSAQDINQGLIASGSLVLNGGFAWLYDSASSSELGFHLCPEIVAANVSGAGGSMGAGKYTYQAVARWTDAQGNLYESIPSPAVAAVTAGGTSSVAITVILPCVTSKPTNITIVVYRSSANGSLLQKITSIVAFTSQLAYSFTDTLADSSLVGSDFIYTNGSVIENTPSPSFTAMTLHHNRLWVIESQAPNRVWYTKALSPGTGISFADLLRIQVDSVGGNCVALASMDSNLVIFEERLPLILSGDGPNDIGTGSTLGNPQPVPSDVGCVSSKCIQSFPMGVLFKSKKGIYLLDRAYNVKYAGIDVEAYNSQNIVSSVLISDRNQIRFLTDSGLTLVFDYIMDQWSTFTNHQGYAADIWQGKYVYARTDGNIFQESPGSYLDGATPFSVLIQTAWLKFAGIQGFQRVRRFGMLGDYANGLSASHGIQVSAAYDFIPTFSTPIPFLMGLSSSSGNLQYRERLPIQKCDAISLIIQEITTGSALETLSLADMSFEAGVKPGINRLSAARSVG